VVDRWPLVGRNRELESIRRALSDGATHVLVLAGSAGVGKTRLALEALDLAAERGSYTARVMATRSAGRLPLGALAPLLPSLTEPLDQAVDMLRWARTTLGSLGGDKPVALLVDDAHLLDDLSATLVWQLAEAGEVFIVATVRTDDSVPDAIVALWKQEVGLRIDVRPLSGEAVGQLLAGVLDAPVDARTQRLLAGHSGGNPLYLKELVAAALDGGTLRRHPDGWRLADEGLVLSDRIVELVDGRIGSLGDAERHALELVTYGEPVSVAALPVPVTSAMERLERRGLVHVDRDGRRLVARLGHPLYGDVVRSRIPAITARTVNRELADVVERTGGRRRDDPLRFAQWRIDGGGTTEPDLMLRAAQAARNYSDLLLARRLTQAALDAGAGLEGDLLAAQLRVLEGDTEGAERCFAQLTARATTDIQRMAVATSRIANLLVGLTRLEDALAVAEEAASRISDADLIVELAAIRAQLLYHSGRSGQALSVADPIIDRAQGRGLLNLAPVAALCLIDAGRLGQAVDVGRRGYEAHVALESPSMAFGPQMHLVPVGVALAWEGRLQEAEDLAQGAYAGAVDAGSAEAQANYAQLLGWILIVRGRATAGARLMSESLALFRELGWKAYIMFALTNLAHAHALRGDIDGATRALSELDALEIPQAHRLGDPMVIQARAWVEAAAGDLTTARRRLLEGADAARRSQSLVLEAALLHDHARLGGAGEVAARLAELADLVEGELMTGRAAYAAALKTGDGVRLSAVAADFDRLGAWLYAAEAAAGAAVAFRRSGDRRQATVLERMAADRARRCEGAVTPALRSVESQAILSARELEVASLAAAGLSNRAIAERLYVSVRTVETQLQHVYQKLGLSGRADLRQALSAS
jgi:DNA-binding CsgD family transcriptional regulator/tetratricopeptide (TPR) repeat protein